MWKREARLILIDVFVWRGRRRCRRRGHPGRHDRLGSECHALCHYLCFEPWFSVSADMRKARIHAKRTGFTCGTIILALAMKVGWMLFTKCFRKEAPAGNSVK